MSSDAKLLMWVAEQVKELQRTTPNYAARSSCARTDEISRLLARYRCDLVEYPFAHAPELVAMALPPIDGVHLIALNRLASHTDQRLAIRHELSHVIASETGSFMGEEGYMAAHERRADLVAIADLVPRGFIEALRRARLAWRAVEVVIRDYLREDLALRWPVDRVRDRARLRLRLFRECGI